jgi:hypothetical protein
MNETTIEFNLSQASIDRENTAHNALRMSGFKTGRTSAEFHRRSSTAVYEQQPRQSPEAKTKRQLDVLKKQRNDLI